MSALFTRNRLIALAVALAVFLVDQWLKDYVLNVLNMQRGDTVDLLPFFDFTLTYNYGVSLGMLEATSMEMRWGLVALTGAIAVVVLVWMFRERRFWEILPLGLVLGGALGNIRDRWLYGYVVDYADLHIGTFRPFLIFNIADAAITIGVLIILARAFLIRDKDDNQMAEPAAEN
jgi:signal peptidase II